MSVESPSHPRWLFHIPDPVGRLSQWIIDRVKESMFATRRATGAGGNVVIRASSLTALQHWYSCTCDTRSDCVTAPDVLTNRCLLVDVHQA